MSAHVPVPPPTNPGPLPEELASSDVLVDEEDEKAPSSLEILEASMKPVKPVPAAVALPPLEEPEPTTARRPESAVPPAALPSAPGPAPVAPVVTMTAPAAPAPVAAPVAIAAPAVAAPVVPAPAPVVVAAPVVREVSDVDATQQVPAIKLAPIASPLVEPAPVIPPAPTTSPLLPDASRSAPPPAAAHVAPSASMQASQPPAPSGHMSAAPPPVAEPQANKTQPLQALRPEDAAKIASMPPHAHASTPPPPNVQMASSYPQKKKDGNGLLFLGIGAAVAVPMLGILLVLGIYGVRRYQQRSLEAMQAAEQHEKELGQTEDLAHADPAAVVMAVPVTGSPALGPATAPVTLVEFGAFDSPECQAAEPTVHALEQHYGDQLRIVWKNLDEGDASELAYEARAQKGDAAFWQVHDALFARGAETQLTEFDLFSIAKDAGLDVDATSRAIHTQKHGATTEGDGQLADRLAVLAPPVFFANGIRVADASLPTLTSAVDAQLTMAAKVMAQGVPPNKVYETLQAQAAPAVDPASLPRVGGANAFGQGAGEGETTSLPSHAGRGSDHAAASDHADKPSDKTADKSTDKAADKTPAEPKAVTAHADRLVVSDLVAGHGPAAKTGSRLTVRYVGKRVDDGVEYDTRHRTAPYSFTLGTGAVTKGWEQGLLGMKAGGKRRLVVPPSLAYGERGNPPSVPPNATLQFDIQLISVE